MLSPAELTFALAQPVARLATADATCAPHVVPVCFAWVDDCFWIAIDEKPKRTTALKRLRNIAENPRVSLLFDHYDDDWSRLGYVMIAGSADILTEGATEPEVLAALSERYPQYRTMALESRPLIRIRVERVARWGALEA